MPVTRVALEKRRGKRGSETKKKRRDAKWVTKSPGSGRCWMLNPTLSITGRLLATSLKRPN